MAKNATVNERAQALLRALIAHYIREGQPVGSKTLAEVANISLSPATIRHVLSDLEEHGYLTSPHTSAGRIPTAKGYRFFVNTLLAANKTDDRLIEELKHHLAPGLSAKDLMSSASAIVSNLTQLTGLVSVPKRDMLCLRHVEFLPLSGNRILVVLVLNEQEVQNRIIYTDKAYSASELEQASNFLNAHYAGKSLSLIRDAVVYAMREDKQRLDETMQVALKTVEQVLSQAQSKEEDVMLSGELNLLNMAEAAGIDTLRSLFDAFSQKQILLHLLDKCVAASDVQLFIGAESGHAVLESCNVITAPYHENGRVIGVVGVLGPTRMDYERVISVVDLTAKLLSSALNSHK
ncbi:MAG: heat-inducible transcription repressor HrcA [Gammaproteobacteria bacterium]|jgi:heat-inducible transcriptional repressor|nr:heat-inducible transcription repressor HrcA [Gammaproteobacteria bacterium]